MSGAASLQSDTQTTRYRACSLCEANCGLAFTFEGEQLLSVRPDDLDVFSRGHICPKGVSVMDIHDDPDRLTRPVQRTASGWARVDRDEAAIAIGKRLAAIAHEYGPDSIAFYSGNPSTHALDFAAHGLALKRAVGTKSLFSANSIDANPHLLVSLLMFGHQLLLPIPDLDRTQTLLIIGANPVVSNGSIMGAPGFRGRVKEIKDRGGEMIVVDPRKNETAKIADQHIFVRPGTDAALLAALLVTLKRRNGVNPGRLSSLLHGWDTAWAAVEALPFERLFDFCGVPEEEVIALAERLQHGPAAVYGRIGLSLQPHATLSVWLVNLLNIALGTLDQPGGAMFGEPAFDPMATGARPAGYARHHSRVSGYPEFSGELPVAALAEEILTPGDGQVRALVTFAGNPVLSLPNGRLLERALGSLEFMASFDIYVNETTRFADYILPSPRPLAVPNYDISLNYCVRNIARIQPAIMPLEPFEQFDWVTLETVRKALCQELDKDFVPLPSPLEVLDRRLNDGSSALLNSNAIRTASISARCGRPSKRGSAPPIRKSNVPRPCYSTALSGWRWNWRKLQDRACA
jgi:anaerobic selenocysteine-containing dehydrogenase